MFFEGVYYKFVGPYSDDIIVVIPVSHPVPVRLYEWTCFAVRPQSAHHDRLS